MLKYAVLILWRKKSVPANFYAFCISAAEARTQNNIDQMYTFAGFPIVNLLNDHIKSKCERLVDYKYFLVILYLRERKLDWIQLLTVNCSLDK